MSWEVIIDHSRPWETMEMVIRRHWIVYVIIWVYLFLGIALTLWLLTIFWFDPLILLLLVIFWMFFSLFLYIEWLNHELDLFVITNNRVVWIEQISFLNRVVSECILWQVQEVWAQTKGFFANILDYWTITILTAWNWKNFVMDFAPEPMEVSRKINNIVDNYRDSHSTWNVNIDWSIKK